MNTKTCILIMEDDEAILELVSTALDYARYSVIPAAKGKIGLILLARFDPALIYLDMHMPVMDGWEFLVQYNSEPARYVPIIAVSAHTSDPRTIPHVAAFLAKPFDVRHLVTLVKGLLARYASV